MRAGRPHLISAEKFNERTFANTLHWMGRRGAGVVQLHNGFVQAYMVVLDAFFVNFKIFYFSGCNVLIYKDTACQLYDLVEGSVNSFARMRYTLDACDGFDQCQFALQMIWVCALPWLSSFSDFERLRAETPL